MNSHSPYQIDKAGLCPRIYCRADLLMAQYKIGSLLNYRGHDIKEREFKVKREINNWNFIMRQINQQMIERY